MRGHRHVAVHHRPARDDETDNDIPVISKKSLLENPPKNIKINLKVDKKQRQGDTTHTLASALYIPCEDSDEFLAEVKNAIFSKKNCLGAPPLLGCDPLLTYYNIQEIYPLLYC